MTYSFRKVLVFMYLSFKMYETWPYAFNSNRVFSLQNNFRSLVTKQKKKIEKSS